MVSADFLNAPDNVGPQTAVDSTAAFAAALTNRFGPQAVARVYGYQQPGLDPAPSKPSASHAPPLLPPLPSSARPSLSLSALPVLHLPPPPPPPRRTPTMTLALPRAPSGPTSSPPRPTGLPPPQTQATGLPDLSALRAVSPAELSTLLDDASTLVLDIRPHAAYAAARLPHAISLSVPSTLLKRPAYPLAKLGDMLPPGARARLLAWPKAKTILVYDADAGVLGPTSNLAGLLKKLAHEGCAPARLAWLQGGFQTVWRSHRTLIDADAPSDEEDDAHASSSGDEASTSLKPTFEASPRAQLRTRNLPQAAFTQTSTTANRDAAALTSRHKAATTRQVAFNPFFDAIRQNLELSQGITDRIPLRLAPAVRERALQASVGWVRDVARCALEEPVADGVIEGRASPGAGAEALAMQFYRIELAEQRRLTGVMQHHSKESQPIPAAGAGAEAALEGEFPYSITAGVEKGAKNRYRNIWPFEHARVKLRRRPSNDDDYVNASFVQPLGTTKRYIATQGPLPATFNDFWALVWEQNVHVIVMLTREIEGAMTKCGHYWSTGTYGSLHLRALESSGTPTTVAADAHKAAAGPAGGYFAAPTPAPAPHSAEEEGTVVRTFELVNTAYPSAPPRRITQLQYLDWPDMNVPESPAGVLGLVKQVEEVVDKAGEGGQVEKERIRARDVGQAVDPLGGVARDALQERPVLVHCSAGVGRTGGYIAVDAVLDGLRRELRHADQAREDEASGSASGEDSMDIDLVSPTEDVQPMDLDAPSSSTTVSSTPRKTAPGYPSPSARRPRRPSGSVPWGKNDPRRAPLRKWVTATADAATTRSPAGTPPFTASPSPSPALGGSALATTPTGSPFPAKDERRVQTLPVPIAPHLPAADPRTRAVSAPSGKRPSPPHMLVRSGAPSSLASLGPSLLFSSDAGESESSRTSPPASASDVTGPHTSKQLSPTPVPSAVLQPTPIFSLSTASALTSPGLAAFDYTYPRALHAPAPPRPLSTLEEPVRQVLEDMREQRMSLCQSLRQYVFVHHAVVEGAVALLEAERAAVRVRVRKESRLGVPPIPIKAKRRHSRTELVKEDRKGGVALTKRPSIKRIYTNATAMPP